MHHATSVPLVRSNASVSDAIIEMTAKSFGIVGVTDVDGRLCGVITDGDIRRNVDDLFSRTIMDVCTKDPITMKPDNLAAEALAIMNDRSITGLIVVNEQYKPIGVLHVHDCLRYGLM